MSYIPQPGSKAEAAIKYIEKKGSGRSTDIAEAIGIEAKNVPGTLKAAVDNGALVACDVVVPGKQPQKEYRIGGGMPPAALNRPAFTINPHKIPPSGSLARPAAAPPPVTQESRNAELAKSLQVTQAVAAKRSSGLGKGAIKRRIVELLETASAPMTAAEIAAKMKCGVNKITNAMTGIVKQGQVDYVKSGLTRAYFLAGKNDLRTNDADLGKKDAAGKSAVRPPKPQQKNATAKPRKNIPEIIPAPLPAAPPVNFRCGIFSDGALRLDGDFEIDNGCVVITRGQTAILVGYLRKLGELELA